MASLGRTPSGQDLGSKRSVRPELRLGDHLDQAGERAEDAREIGFVVLEVEKGDLAHDRVHAAECLHGRVGAEIRRAQRHDALEALEVVRQGRAGDKAAHAVSHKLGGPSTAIDVLGQLLAEICQAEPPVVRPELGVVPGNAQLELQLEVCKQDHAQGADAAAARRPKGELSKPSCRDIDRVEPQHVVQQRACIAELRAHDAWQDHHALSAAHGARGGLARQGTQLDVACGPEKLLQQARLVAGAQGLLDDIVRQRKRLLTLRIVSAVRPHRRSNAAREGGLSAALRRDVAWFDGHGLAAFPSSS